MAIVSIPILGQASGKFSDSEFYRINGINVLRSSKLKRYKLKTETSIYYQNLLKYIVRSTMPLISLMRNANVVKKYKLNFFNRFIKHNYNLFSLNEAGLLLCSDITSIKFYDSDISLPVSGAISSYSSTYLDFYLNSKYVLNPSNMDVYLILCKQNFRDSALFSSYCINEATSLYRMEFHEPPFNSADYHVFAAIFDYSSELFFKQSYLFLFSHG